MLGNRASVRVDALLLAFFVFLQICICGRYITVFASFKLMASKSPICHCGLGMENFFALVCNILYFGTLVLSAEVDSLMDFALPEKNGL